MFDSMRSVEEGDLLRRMHDKIESLSDLIDQERDLSNGGDVDPQWLDARISQCVDLVMSEETSWL